MVCYKEYKARLCESKTFYYEGVSTLYASMFSEVFYPCTGHELCFGKNVIIEATYIMRYGV